MAARPPVASSFLLLSFVLVLWDSLLSAPCDCLADLVGLLMIIEHLWADVAPVCPDGRLALLSYITFIRYL